MTAKAKSILMYVLGMILCPLGVALCANAGFGVSMIEAPVYVAFLKFSAYSNYITYGSMEYVLQAIVLILLCITVKKFKAKYLLSFLTAVIFGFILDGWRLVVGAEVYGTMPIRIIACAFGILITSFAVSCFFRTELPQEVWELFVKEFSELRHFEMTKVKFVYDFSSLLVGIILMFIFFHKFDINAIGPATIIMTFANAPFILLFGKAIDKVIPVKNEDDNNRVDKND